MQIDSRKFYTPAEAAALLEVKEATVKGYCRAGRASGIPLVTKKVGPRHEWRIQGASIARLREAWKLDT